MEVSLSVNRPLFQGLKCLILAFIVLASCSYAHSMGIPVNENERLGGVIQYGHGIDNGWYEAEVDYFNPKTYTRKTYILDVKVEQNKVTVISFGDGALHDGINRSGYMYSGGHLNFERNYDNEIVAAYTRVSIIKGSNTLTFDIRIE